MARKLVEVVLHELAILRGTKMKRGRMVLSVNAGSSSLKLSLYRVSADGEQQAGWGHVDRIGQEEGHFAVYDGDGNVLAENHNPCPLHGDAMKALCRVLRKSGVGEPDAIGHRLVHGGERFTEPALIDPEVMNELRELIPFAPLHLPAQIQCIETAYQIFPGLCQVGCFDTALHRRMPEAAQRYPLPRWLWDEGVRRYGFHGLSYEYILSVLPDNAAGRIIIAHLGQGASLAAVRDGQPVDTTMGFTPTGGLMMATRSGDLDPGVLLYLMDVKGYDAAKIDDLVNFKAGLWGVSNGGSDMKTLLARRQSDPFANQAIEMFCYYLRKYIGSLTAVLGGLDTLVFTGGIGEKGAAVRWEACQGLEYLGIALDAEKNDANADIISTSDSRCCVRVIPTNENLMIARHTNRIVCKQAGPSG